MQNTQPLSVTGFLIKPHVAALPHWHRDYTDNDISKSVTV